ncbi:hypothetical protein M406DRAFT_357256 [Cryphonectria parasitica EP155]|uniref:NADH-ubiquinone oxidoreductase 21.3 kDa subunit n=1 Tax=Cryphonectria parasitica (strain ATCC 38755 / EP155) TaxID=660469 RepID=A0A9P5CM03_CRYP1|nr:uncharacterized protein M406DRAFT_357256 [Cryphonectria parasitica EP155]KAF3763864.1 hypothetical protein M406DRAFT_357256 [Cryphonectria parasitica EP155]
MAPHGESDEYHPGDALAAGVKGAMITGAAGLFAASVKNATRKTNVGALSVFTKSGGLIFTFTAVGGTFEFFKQASANLRQKNDHYNAGIGGFLAGSLLGMRSGRMSVILGYGAATSVALSLFEYSGGSLRGKTPEIAGMDAAERRDYLRKIRRKPIEETLEGVGEGRGIQPPGYQERRRERLKENYGFEVNPVSADVA